MEIRIRSTGQVVTDSEFRSLHPNTSFPQQLNAQLLNDFGADPVLEGPQAQPTRYQTAFRDGVKQINGKWYTNYSVADMNDEAKAVKDSEQSKSVRVTRNQKLTESDWTQVIDAPVDQAVWAAYRQSLRDLPSQPDFPWDITWPTKPE